MTSRKRPEDLRSHRWLGVNDLRAFGHRSRLRQGGFDAADFRGKPVIGIVNTWSDINFCHTHLRDRAEDVMALLRSDATRYVIVTDAGDNSRIARYELALRFGP